MIKPAKNALAGDYAINVRASAGSQSSTLDLRYGVKGSTTLGIVAIVIIAVTFLGLAWLFRRLGRTVTSMTATSTMAARPSSLTTSPWRRSISPSATATAPLSTR